MPQMGNPVGDLLWGLWGKGGTRQLCRRVLVDRGGDEHLVPCSKGFLRQRLRQSSAEPSGQAVRSPFEASFSPRKAEIWRSLASTEPVWCLFPRVLEKRQFQPACHGLRPAVDVELAIDVLQMLFDRARGDDQSAGDLLVRQPFGQQSQHL